MDICTLTGVDEKTNLKSISALSDTYPFVEWGFLYSPKRQGTPGRYPSVTFLKQALRDLPAAVKVSLHICGSGVPDLFASEDVISELVSAIHGRGGRVQLNFNHGKLSLEANDFERLQTRYSGLRFIVQSNKANASLISKLAGTPDIQVLFDTSGGRGIYIADWPDYIDKTYCGYAGGLGGHECIDEQLRGVFQAASGRPFWIDMESCLRTIEGCEDGWFDIFEARKILSGVDVEIQHQAKVA